MKIVIEQGQDTKQDLLALGLFAEEQDAYKDINPVLDAELKKAIKKESFKQDFGSMYVTKITNSTYEKIMVLSLGKKSELTPDRIRRAAAKIVRFMQAASLQGATTNIAEVIASAKLFSQNEIGRAISEGLILSEYVFDKYLSKPKIKKIDIAVLSWQGDRKEFEKGISVGKIIAENTNYVKQLVNEPADYMTPKQIEKEAQKLKALGIKITVLGTKELQKEGMNGLLSVGKGSIHEPRLIILEYNGGGKEKSTAIVGKGIAFDSGGYDLKPSTMALDMKDDMAGAAAIIGAIKTAAELGLKKNIIGVMPTCENMISGGAYKPGDILRMHNGKTVEITNTDAEGRLVLADALSYTEKTYKPVVMIDLATLTGACVVALGPYVSGLITNNEALKNKLIAAGNASFDRAWELPFFEEYWESMDGDASDLVNSSKKLEKSSAGTITGGVFLSKFIGNTMWAHLDIAATAYVKEQRDYTPKFATGAGVRLLTYYFMD